MADKGRAQTSPCGFLVVGSKYRDKAGRTLVCLKVDNRRLYATMRCESNEEEYEIRQAFWCDGRLSLIPPPLEPVKRRQDPTAMIASLLSAGSKKSPNVVS